MRVVLTNVSAWPHVRRGSEALLQSLGGWLAGRDHDVTVVAGGPRRANYDIDGLSYETVPGTSRLSRAHRDLDEVTTAIPGMALTLRRRDPDVVHSLHFVDGTAARLSRRPYLVFYGGIALRESFRGHPVLRALFRVASDGAAVVACPSHAVRTHLRHAYGIDATVVPNGIDVRSFATIRVDREHDLIFCPATADDHRKRVEVLVQAFASLVHADSDLRLVLAGAASDATRQRLTRLAGAAAERIEFAGTLDSTELGQMYASAAVTCLPSLHEAFGLVLIESMACGTPVVGTHHGAIPEIVTPETGTTFEPDDPDDCARALRAVLSWWPDPDLPGRCRRRAESYDWDEIGPIYETLYAKMQ